jgi:deazaflavin-dependent oxidoreductase (nitroreductase family)
MAQSATTQLLRPPASRLARAFQQAPKYLYRGPMAVVLSRRFVLRLTTVGRKSGLARETPLTFMPLDGPVVVYAGARGDHADWYRNVRAHPEVWVRIGRQRFRASAHSVEQPVARRELARRFQRHQMRCGPPQLIRWVGRMLVSRITTPRWPRPSNGLRTIRSSSSSLFR